MPCSTSIFVIASASAPLISHTWRADTASNQPQRRGRPVTVPNSLPFSCMRRPVSSSRSVGNGPASLPTRVTYAFATATTRSIDRAGSPVPDGMPLAPVLLDDTKG